MRSEVSATANFSEIRYAQCWEDADVLLEALAVRPGDTCLSIASAGDNTLSLLAGAPGRVLALDLSPAQLSCLELRVAAYRALEHGELLELLGSRPSRRRPELYRRCRSLLSGEARRFWDAHASAVEGGIGGAGRFERYFALFRERVLPLVHPRRRWEQLLRGGPPAERERFYAEEWDTWRWRLLFRLFFSRFAMGRLGRDPEFFRYVQGGVAARILGRVRHALTALDPAENPYLHWILLGRHGEALPNALRPENFGPIREHLDRLEWHCLSLEEFLERGEGPAVDRFNLSDVFEYMSAESYRALLSRIVRAARPGARLAYWNMLAPRSRPPELADRLQPCDELSRSLFLRDKAFFYSAFVVEQAL